MVINLTPQLEAVLTEQGRQRGVAQKSWHLTRSKTGFYPRCRPSSLVMSGSGSYSRPPSTAVYPFPTGPEQRWAV